MQKSHFDAVRLWKLGERVCVVCWNASTIDLIAKLGGAGIEFIVRFSQKIKILRWKKIVATSVCGQQSDVARGKRQQETCGMTQRQRHDSNNAESDRSTQRKYPRSI
jgi:hypothetical protein